LKLPIQVINKGVYNEAFHEVLQFFLKIRTVRILPKLIDFYRRGMKVYASIGKKVVAFLLVAGKLVKIDTFCLFFWCGFLPLLKH